MRAVVSIRTFGGSETRIVLNNGKFAYGTDAKVPKKDERAQLELLEPKASSGVIRGELVQDVIIRHDLVEIVVGVPFFPPKVDGEVAEDNDKRLEIGFVLTASDPERWSLRWIR